MQRISFLETFFSKKNFFISENQLSINDNTTIFLFFVFEISVCHLSCQGFCILVLHKILQYNIIKIFFCVFPDTDNSTDISEDSFSPLVEISSETSSPVVSSAISPPAISFTLPGERILSSTIPHTISPAMPPPIISSATLPVTLSSIPSPAVDTNIMNNTQIRKNLSNISTKRKVPVPDSFAAKKKRQEEDAVNKCLIEQSKGLTDLAAKIGEAITVPSPTSSTLSTIVSDVSSSIKPMLSAIGFAPSSILEKVQLECLIGILQYINDFSKN